MIECKLDAAATGDFLSRLAALGARPLRGFAPVPMETGTTVLTVTLDRPEDAARLQELPEVIEVFGDSPIAPLAAEDPET